jgi:hypothetical protein
MMTAAKAASANKTADQQQQPMSEQRARFLRIVPQKT